MVTTVFFFLFAGLAIASAISLVYHKNPLYSAVSLIGVFISLACIYVTLAAPFIAAVQILIYAGAIMVLVVFVIMLLNLGRRPTAQSFAVSVFCRRRIGRDFARADVFHFLRRLKSTETSRRSNGNRRKNIEHRRINVYGISFAGRNRRRFTFDGDHRRRDYGAAFEQRRRSEYQAGQRRNGKSGCDGKDRKRHEKSGKLENNLNEFFVQCSANLEL